MDMTEAQKLYESIWVDNGTHSEGYVIGKIAEGLATAHAAGAAEMQKRAVDALEEQVESEYNCGEPCCGYMGQTAKRSVKIVAALPTAPVGRPHAARPADGGGS